MSTYQPYRSFNPSPMTDQIWSSLMASTNNNPIQSAGIMGNIGIESSFNPEIVNQNENAFGLLQLRNDRLDNFRKYQEANPEMSLVDQQIRYIFEQGNPDSPYKDPIAAKYFERIMNQNDPMSIARLFDKRFERSAGWLVDPNDPSMGYNEFGTTTRDRMNLANDIYKYYTNQQNNLGETGQTNVQPKNKNFIGKIRDLMTDPDFSDDLRLWANSMRLRPDQNMAMSIMQNRKDREAKRLLQVDKNAAMQYVANLPEGSLKNMLANSAQHLKFSDVVKMANDEKKLIMDTEIKLADKFDKNEMVDNFIKRADYLGTILTNARKPSQTGDVALVYTFMKMLDPDSTVNPGELALARNIGSVPERIRSLYNSLLVGEVNLTPKQRMALVNSAKQTYDESKIAYQSVYDHYLKKAEAYGLNPDNFVQKYGLNEEQYTDLSDLVEGFEPNLQEVMDANQDAPFSPDQVNYDGFEQWLKDSNSNMLTTWQTLDRNAKFLIMTQVYKQQVLAGNEAEFEQFLIQQQ